MEDNVVFLTLKVLDSDNFSIVSEARNVVVTFVEKPQIKMISFQKQKTWISFYDKTLSSHLLFISRNEYICSLDLLFYCFSVRNVNMYIIVPDV